MKTTNSWRCSALGALLLTAAGFVTGQPAAGEPSLDPGLVERGRYLARVAGCNDCHTPDYAGKDGRVPLDRWLSGDRFGWRGPWGTTW